jgi:hypothetical protein
MALASLFEQHFLNFTLDPQKQSSFRGKPLSGFQQKPSFKTIAVRVGSEAFLAIQFTYHGTVVRIE